MTSETPSAMLGEGAIALHRAAFALDAVRDRLDAFGAGLFETELRARPYDQLGLLGREMDALTEELAAKLSREHDAVVAFAGARDAVHDIVRTLGLLRNPDARADLRKLADQTIEQVAGLRDEFDACRDGFMDAARGSPGKG